jgi:tyrosyl-tRNA synthetase
MGVELQMGGADQWGNITAGLELIRRRAGLAGETETTHGASDRAADGASDRGADEPASRGADGASDRGSVELAHGLAYRLLLSPSGSKFGKTEGGDSVWLDAERTSPFAFYQYWLNADDRDVGTYLRWFTLLTREEIEALEAEGRARPEARASQRALAHDVTERTQGAAAAAHAALVSEAAFSRDPIRDPAILATLHDSVGGFAFTDVDLGGGVLAIATASGLFASGGEARRAIAQGGLTINDERITAVDAPVPPPIDGEWLVVRSGKRRLAIGRRRR